VLYAALALGAVLDLTGGLDRIALLEGPVAQTAGVVLAIAALPLIVVAQEAMGRSWRIGVDPHEQTTLVTAGPFHWIRNPIYSGMLLMAAGIALILPSAATIAGLAVFVVAIELETRAVEEPYLLRTHGESFRRYAATSGRFLPGIGRLR
jgi:protein-S-isoprenylcysteine O-methyltransferase Ste14